MSASVKSVRQFGTKSRLDSLRLQLMAGEMARQIGRRIRERRMELGLNQRELAERLGTSALDNQRISDWERGINRPSERYMKQLVEILDRPLEWFYAADEKPNETPDLIATMNGDTTQLDRIEQLLVALAMDAGIITERAGARDAQRAVEDWMQRRREAS